MTLRIVHLGKYYHPHAGGIETHVRTLAAVQAARGNEVHVVCVNHDRTLDRTYWDGPVSVRRFTPRWSFGKLEWVPEVSRYLDDLHCDILHIHVPNPTMTLAVLSMATKIPLVATYHSDVIGMPLRRWMFGPWERRLLSRTAAIGATNPRMAEASACLALHRERVRIIPMGIALDRFVAPRPEVEQRASQIHQAGNGPVWLMCGRLVPYKGHAVALDALRDVPGDLGDHWRRSAAAGTATAGGTVCVSAIGRDSWAASPTTMSPRTIAPPRRTGCHRSCRARPSDSSRWRPWPAGAR